MTEDFSKPVFFEKKLRLFDTKRPAVFMLTGMSDAAYWEEEWLNRVMEKAAHTHNVYLFLTKRPERMQVKTYLDNLWFGVSVTSAAEKERIEVLRSRVIAKHYYVTFEPLSEAVGNVNLEGIEWVVVGTETGHCRGKIPTQRNWAESLAGQARAKGIPVFMKEDLCGIIEEGEMVQQFPKEFMV